MQWDIRTDTQGQLINRILGYVFVDNTRITNVCQNAAEIRHERGAFK